MNKKQSNKNKLRAAATVEAAVIIPFAIFVVCTLITLTLYIHDRVVLQSAVCEIAVVGENFITAEEGKEAVKEIAESITVDRLQGSRNLSGEQKVKEKKTKASYKAEYVFPGYALEFLSKSQGDISVSWEHGRIEPVLSIRVIRGVSKFVEEHFDFGFMKKKEADNSTD